MEFQLFFKVLSTFSFLTIIALDLIIKRYIVKGSLSKHLTLKGILMLNHNEHDLRYNANKTTHICSKKKKTTQIVLLQYMTYFGAF